MNESRSYRTGMILVTGSSMLVPVVGLATAPILAHALGVIGRGEAGAAIAPHLVIIGGVTLGLPQALTYIVARRTHVQGAALAVAVSATVVLGALGFLGVYLTSGLLSAGDPRLERLMLLGAALAVPAMMVGLLRGVAVGRQLWRVTALERSINSVLRLIALAVLALAGSLTVTAAVLVMCLSNILGCLAYFNMVRGDRHQDTAEEDRPGWREVGPELLSYGFQHWLGSLVTLALARTTTLLMTPLSGTEQLGLFVVAVTISDLPYVITNTIREVAFGANSAVFNAEQLLTTSRVTLFLTVLTSTAIGVTLPLWIGLLFGADFRAATVTTWVLLVASTSAVPGLVASAALDALGRPVIRSLALTAGLVVNVVALLLLVPPFGALGAAAAGLASSLVQTVLITWVSARMMGVPGHRFVVPTRADLALVLAVGPALRRRLTGSRGG